jgi:PAS domain S-box-containing protein
MISSLRSFLLLLLFLSVAIIVSVLLFTYVFSYTTWAVTTKLTAVLGYVAFVLLGLTWYQASVNARLKLRLTAVGQGSESLFSDLYQNSPVAYFRTDARGNILHGNAAALRLCGMTTETLVLTNLFTFTRELEEGVQKSLTLEQRIRAGQFVNEVEATLSLGGQLRYVLVSAFPYSHHRERLVTLIDITAQKAVDIAKTEFVSLASHQLRTPISAVLWNLELLAGLLKDAPKEQVAYVEKVRRSTEKMNELINDFLDATKLEMGTFATKLAPVALNTFLAQVLESFDMPIAAKSIQLSVAPLSSDVVIETDAALLTIITSNLISNAVKYTPEHGSVLVALSMVPGGVAFRVRDTGIGIPADDQPHLFSKLYRASNTKTSPTEGTGLGLYVVKQAVELLQGSITFASTEGVGTEFLVTLPARH